MAITANGVTVATVVANGVTVNTVVANGVTVFTATVTTATPGIQNVSATASGFGASVSWRVRNNDAATATILSDVTTNPPTTSRGSIASGSLTGTISLLNQPQTGVIYARATASGKDPSAVASVSYSI